MTSETAETPAEWAARISELDVPTQLLLVQRVLAGLAAPTVLTVWQAALKLQPAEQAQLAQQLLLTLADLPSAQLEATLAIEARRQVKSN